ncbi:uncharacterized protein LOC101854511 isoform X2 [Aplysia californica]|nr:uncharacterized protein LOC101854511 isoform X2 [Aplysia californica]
MGNHGSRRDQRKWARQGGKAADALNRVEELRGGAVDSYDKLIAWLAEMAESDNVELDTSVFVSQLNRVCGGHAQNNFLGVSGPALGGAMGGGASASCRRAVNVRQNSASCDSHVSHASSDFTQKHRGSMRSEDFLDPRAAWKSGVCSRQNTFSDDLEEEDPDVRNASMESLYSSTDRDSELGSVSAYDATSRRSGRTYNSTNSGSPLLRTAMTNRLCRGGVKQGGATPRSSSTGNLLDIVDNPDGTPKRQFSGAFCSRRSVSLLNLSPPAPMIPYDGIPKLVFTQEDDVSYTDTSSDVTTHMVARKLGSRKKSSTGWSSRQKANKFERQISLHAEGSPCGSSSNSGSATPVYPPPTVAEPEKAQAPAAPAFLNDALLDGNLADILFSVEALWPKK